MGRLSCSAKCSNGYDAYKKKWQLYYEALTDASITENFQKPEVNLQRERTVLDYHEKFYRVATEPLFLIDIHRFFEDLDELIEKHSGGKITVDDFCEFFKKKEVWDEHLDSKGDLKIKRLLLLDELERPPDKVSKD